MIAIAECLSCGIEFTPRKEGHVFHSVGCRHRGERRPEERAPVDLAAIERLFDESRDLGERVRGNDWHPNPDTPLADLDGFDTVGSRRRWYLNLVRLGRI